MLHFLKQDSAFKVKASFLLSKLFLTLGSWSLVYVLLHNNSDDNSHSLCPTELDISIIWEAPVPFSPN